MCVRIAPVGSNGLLQATLTKNGGGTFMNNVDLTMFSPSTNRSEQLGCVSTSGLTSYSFSFDPSQLGLSLGSTIAVNAQVFSPCVGGANYISGNGAISQCTF